MVASIKARLRRASPPFYEAVSLYSDDVTFKQRAGRRVSLVAVDNSSAEDHRLKIWLTEEHPGGDFLINDESVNVPHVKDGFHQGAIDPDVLEKIIRPSAPIKIGVGADIPTVDVCIETVFNPDDRDNYGNWKGNIADTPEWMGLEQITITPPSTGGGMHQLAARLGDGPGRKLYVKRHLFWWRINGVWCQVLPVAETISTGWAEFRGLVSITCDPADLAIIRGYGEGGIAEVLEDEPMPPRVDSALQKLRQVVPDEVIRPWRRDIKTLTGLLFGMNQSKGQMNFHTQKIELLETRLSELERWLTTRFDKRGEAYKAYELNDWIQEVGGKPVEWQASIKRIKQVIPESRYWLERHNESLERTRDTYNEVIDRIEALEEKYADEIQDLYVDTEAAPPPPTPSVLEVTT